MLFMSANKLKFLFTKNAQFNKSYRNFYKITIEPLLAVIEHLLNRNHTAEHNSFSVSYNITVL